MPTPAGTFTALIMADQSELAGEAFVQILQGPTSAGPWTPTASQPANLLIPTGGVFQATLITGNFTLPWLRLHFNNTGGLPLRLWAPVFTPAITWAPATT